jgi:hypothetical protein
VVEVPNLMRNFGMVDHTKGNVLAHLLRKVPLGTSQTLPLNLLPINTLQRTRSNSSQEMKSLFSCQSTHTHVRTHARTIATRACARIRSAVHASKFTPSGTQFLPHLVICFPIVSRHSLSSSNLPYTTSGTLGSAREENNRTGTSLNVSG